MDRLLRPDEESLRFWTGILWGIAWTGFMVAVAVSSIALIRWLA